MSVTHGSLDVPRNTTSPTYDVVKPEATNHLSFPFPVHYRVFERLNNSIFKYRHHTFDKSVVGVTNVNRIWHFTNTHDGTSI